MDVANKEFAFAGSLEELKAKGRLVLHGDHRPILVIYDRGRVLALDNRCPHMGFPLERGSVEDGIYVARRGPRKRPVINDAVVR
jgi:nitrite reductase/ring-hydroxylating ferredoxin subunit